MTKNLDEIDTILINIVEDIAIIEDEDDVEDDMSYISPTGRKVKYVNNKDLLKEIHKSKLSFCEFVDDKYTDYDLIVENLEDIFLIEKQEEAKKNRADRLYLIAFEQAVANTVILTKADRPKQSGFKIDPDTMSVDDLVFRVLTFDHIPLAPGRKKNPKSVADNYMKLNFAPFKHVMIVDGGVKEVGKSHSKNSKFNIDRGSITNKLAKMFIMLVNNYSTRGNWRSYSYLEEMKGQSLLQLSVMGLQFDEYKSDNPFAYYTRSLENVFTRILNLEKKNQNLRDDLLINNGASPSFARQLELEEETRKSRESRLGVSKDE